MPSKWMLRVGPAEWLGLFKNAKYVVTDSFHGAVFSLLFHRQFMIEVNEKNKNVGGRIYDLLHRVGLEKRMMNHEVGANIDEKIDWANVDTIIEKAREESLQYLNSLIEG